MVHYDQCPLCLSRNIGERLDCTDHFVSGRLFQIAGCSDCGFVFTQDPPGEDEIGSYYESGDYISHSDTSKGVVNKLYRFARGLMLKRKRNIVARVTGRPTGLLLDIGSGTGYFADTMKRGGWDVKGIEINEKARNFSQSAFGLDISSPENLPSLGKNSFDCITLWHVMEHFHDPGKYISEIADLLKPEGICLVALPNSSSYDARYYGPDWAAWDVPRHLWHYTPETFSLFAKQHEMKVVSQLILPLDVFYISILSEKYKGSSIPLVKGGMLALWFTIRTIFNRKRCSSVIYILKKTS
jgi:2-polyprenyl-3-methyl-5-hydroxy-6-metoxy-1,4-benzoquinol methylase